MAEYIDREKLIPDRCYYEPYGYEAVSCEQIFHEDVADVVERSEYNEMFKYLNAQIHNKENNLRDNREAYRLVVKELDELRNKIDNAIKEMEVLPKDCEYELSVSACLEILKRNVGEK